MDMVMFNALLPDHSLAKAVIHRVSIDPGSNLVFQSEYVENKDYKIVQISSEIVMFGENVGGEIVFEDALQIHTGYGMDAKTLEALRKHRMEHGQLVVLMSPLQGRTPLPIPEGAHKAFWAYTL